MTLFAYLRYIREKLRIFKYYSVHFFKVASFVSWKLNLVWNIRNLTSINKILYVWKNFMWKVLGWCRKKKVEGHSCIRSQIVIFNLFGAGGSSCRIFKKILKRWSVQDSHLLYTFKTNLWQLMSKLNRILLSFVNNEPFLLQVRSSQEMKRLSNLGSNLYWIS